MGFSQTPGSCVGPWPKRSTCPSTVPEQVPRCSRVNRTPHPRIAAEPARRAGEARARPSPPTGFSTDVRADRPGPPLSPGRSLASHPCWNGLGQGWPAGPSPKATRSALEAGRGSTTLARKRAAPTVPRLVRAGKCAPRPGTPAKLTTPTGAGLLLAKHLPQPLKAPRVIIRDVRGIRSASWTTARCRVPGSLESPVRRRPARNQALGELLVRTAMAYGLRHHRRLVLDVMVKDTAAIRLYDRLGWLRTGLAEPSTRRCRRQRSRQGADPTGREP
jgi:hypothetical protein